MMLNAMVVLRMRPTADEGEVNALLQPNEPSLMMTILTLRS
jgi:hypothetical protein